MTFANVSVNQEQLTSLSQLLVTTFPGCTIHQSSSPVRVMHHLSAHKLDAVFTDADTYAEMSRILVDHKSKPSIYLICRQDRQPPEGMGGIRGIVTYPITKQKIQIALQTVPRETREVI